MDSGIGETICNEWHSKVNPIAVSYVVELWRTLFGLYSVATNGILPWVRATCGSQLCHTVVMLLRNPR
jgi:hypothetical protein